MWTPNSLCPSSRHLSAHLGWNTQESVLVVLLPPETHAELGTEVCIGLLWARRGGNELMSRIWLAFWVKSQDSLHSLALLLTYSWGRGISQGLKKINPKQTKGRGSLCLPLRETQVLIIDILLLQWNKCPAWCCVWNSAVGIQRVWSDSKSSLQAARFREGPLQCLPQEGIPIITLIYCFLDSIILS